MPRQCVGTVPPARSVLSCHNDLMARAVGEWIEKTKREARWREASARRPTGRARPLGHVNPFEIHQFHEFANCRRGGMWTRTAPVRTLQPRGSGVSKLFITRREESDQRS